MPRPKATIPRRLLVLPTWLIARAAAPHLPEGHPWRGRRFTLDEWAAGSTRLGNAFSVALWLCLLAFLVALAALA